MPGCRSGFNPTPLLSRNEFRLTGFGRPGRILSACRNYLAFFLIEIYSELQGVTLVGKHLFKSAQTLTAQAGKERFTISVCSGRLTAQELTRASTMSSMNLEPPEWSQGTHLVTPRFGYRHHGIYIGNGRVLHYAGLCEWWRIGPVEEVSLDSFCSEHPILVKEHPKAKYRGEAAVARARSRLGESRYSLFNNNCEHLCTWSIDGIGYSEQAAALLVKPVIILERLAELLQKLHWSSASRT
jgi:Lecithin retinol acyltransferase